LLDAVERLVINTGPVIALGRADALAVIEKLPIRFITPPAVAAEIAAGATAGHPVLLPRWIEVIALAAPVPPLICQMLDAGEVVAGAYYNVELLRRFLQAMGEPPISGRNR